MALISATVSPSDDIRTTDFEGSHGRVVGLHLDGVDVFLGHYGRPDDQDAAVVATANLLIGVLVGLRDAAARRIAIANVDLVDMAPGEIVALFGR